jgi:predicted metalloprotease with PDZ domain
MGQGIAEAEAELLCEEVSGLKLKKFFDRYVRGTEDIPFGKLMAPYGITVTDHRKEAKPSLGVRTAREGNDCKLANVYEDGAAHEAGLSAGDLLVAVNGLRVTATNLDAVLSRYRAGDIVAVHAFRRDELMTFSVVLAQGDAPQFVLEAQEKAAAPTRKRARWLAAPG